jgi:hypothetical protein
VRHPRTLRWLWPGSCSRETRAWFSNSFPANAADLNGRQMWLRVKGETEDAVLKFGFHDVYALRPGFIQPVRGAASRNHWVRWFYRVTDALYPILQKRFDRVVTSTDLLAEAMLRLATMGDAKKIVRTGDLNRLARSF